MRLVATQGRLGPVLEAAGERPIGRQRRGGVGAEHHLLVRLRLLLVLQLLWVLIMVVIMIVVVVFVHQELLLMMLMLLVVVDVTWVLLLSRLPLVRLGTPREGAWQGACLVVYCRVLHLGLCLYLGLYLGLGLHLGRLVLRLTVDGARVQVGGRAEGRALVEARGAGLGAAADHARGRVLRARGRVRRGLRAGRAPRQRGGGRGRVSDQRRRLLRLVVGGRAGRVHQFGGLLLEGRGGRALAHGRLLRGPRRPHAQVLLLLVGLRGVLQRRRRRGLHCGRLAANWQLPLLLVLRNSVSVELLLQQGGCGLLLELLLLLLLLELLMVLLRRVETGLDQLRLGRLVANGLLLARVHQRSRRPHKPLLAHVQPVRLRGRLLRVGVARGGRRHLELGRGCWPLVLEVLVARLLEELLERRGSCGRPMVRLRGQLIARKRCLGAAQSLLLACGLLVVVAFVVWREVVIRFAFNTSRLCLFNLNCNSLRIVTLQQLSL